MDGTFTIYNKKLYKRVIATILTLVIFCVSISLGMVTSDISVSAGGHSAIVMEVSTKRTLYSSNIHQRLPMASTTKIVTGLVVIENAKLDSIVTIPKQAVGVEGSSIYLQEGEKLTVKELLYGLMLRSGNDAAAALAIYVAGNVESFAELMNAKAIDLGLKDSHFTNPHGLHHENHYTSAYDLATISAFAMQNETFAEIVGTKITTINGVSYKRQLCNKNKILSQYPGGTGIKTGFTKKAGRCLVASSKREGLEVVVVVLNCGPMFEECARLMDNAHNEYAMVNVGKSEEVVADITVLKGVEKKVQVALREDIWLPLKKNGSDSYELKLNLPNSATAPLEKHQRMGEMEISLNDCLLFTKNIYSINGIKKKGAIDYLKGFFK